MAAILEAEERHFEIEGAKEMELSSAVLGVLFSIEAFAVFDMSLNLGLFFKALDCIFAEEVKITFGAVFVEGACAVLVVGLNVFFVFNVYFVLCGFLILLDRLRVGNFGF